jgi:hypothetical protein
MKICLKSSVKYQLSKITIDVKQCNTKNVIFLRFWLWEVKDASTEILKKTQDINGVRLLKPMSSGLTSLMGCRFITWKIFYN